MNFNLFKSREGILTVVILLLLLLISVRFPSFVSLDNLGNVFNDSSMLIMLALGQMIVILTRCIDLSVAANLALTGMVVAILNNMMPELPIIVMVLTSILFGSFLGAINGILVWKLAIPSIVVTLSTLTIYRGTIFLISGGSWINAHEMSDSFKSFPRIEIFNLPVLSWIAILCVGLAFILMHRVTLGRAFYAVGGNPLAAIYAGINVGKTQFYAFVVSGALAGLTGYLWVSRYAVAYVDIASGFSLDVIAACVIGGVSIAGGVGSVWGVVVGALFLGIIKNALPVINVSPFWQLAITGAAIIIAVAFNGISGRKKGRVILRNEEVTS